MQLNRSFSFLLLSLVFIHQAHSMNLDSVPENMRETYRNFLSNSFRAEGAPKEWSHLKNGVRIYHLKYPDDMDSPPKIGYCHKKNIEVFHAARTLDQILFRVQYKFDQHRRRSVGLERRDEQTKHIILAGCSYAMGTGLADHDTIGFHLARVSKSHYPINIGVAGSGTNTMLAMTKENLSSESVFSERGVFVYIFLDFHIPRANAFAMEREWLWDSPFYESNSGRELVYKGNFKDAQPKTTKFYKFTQRLLKSLGIAFNFPRRGKTHVDYACSLIEQAKKDYLKKFPGNRFVVYAHPDRKVGQEFSNCLKSINIELIVSKLKLDKKEHFIPFDAHPNGHANRLIANELARELSL